MQRTRRGLEIQEIVEAFNAIIEIIVECYNHPLRERFKDETRLSLKEEFFKDIRILDGELKGSFLRKISLRLEG